MARLIRKENVARFARKIIEQNRVLGFSEQEKLKKYFDLVVKIGIGYQHDPQFLRISEAVHASSSPDDSLRILQASVNEFQAKVLGSGGEYYYAALQHVLNTSYDAWHKPNSEIEVAAMLANLYPERYEYAGEQALIDLVGVARHEGGRWGLPPLPGISLMTGLMFFLGVDCAADPLQPWIAKKLQENCSPGRKARELFDIGRRLAKNVLRLRKI